MLDLEQILSELEEKTDLSRDQIKKKIDQKHQELLGLVSLEGAGHLVARDLGINLLTVKRKPLKIEKLTEGMKDVSVRGRISYITPIKEFKRKDGSEGKVCNLIISDGTGDIRIPLWDKQVSMVENDSLKLGHAVEVKNGYVKNNPYGGLEITLPRYSEVRKIQDNSLPQVEEKTPNLSKRIDIKDVKEGFYEIRGNFVQLFNTKNLLYLCPECRKSLEKEGDKFECKEHGEVKPDPTMVVSGILDDGTSTIRAVFFRDQAQKLSGIDLKSLEGLSDEEMNKLVEDNVLGREIIVTGKVRRNKLFDNLEIMGNDVQEMSPLSEGKKLIDQIESYGDSNV